MSETELYRRLGIAIAARRAELGITQAQVAAQIGLTRASLANIETGRQKMMLHQIYRLVEALKVKSVLDLIPPTYSYVDNPEPVTFTGGNVSDSLRAQVTQFVRTVKT